MIPKKKKCICDCISSLHFELHFGFIQQILLFGPFIAPKKKLHLALHFEVFRCISILLYFDDADHDFLKKSYNTLEC
jgi:hypothetical protein